MIQLSILAEITNNKLKSTIRWKEQLQWRSVGKTRSSNEDDLVVSANTAQALFEMWQASAC